MVGAATEPSTLRGLIGAAVRAKATEVYIVEHAPNEWRAEFYFVGRVVSKAFVSADEAGQLESAGGRWTVIDGFRVNPRKIPKNVERGGYEPGNRCLEIKLFPDEAPRDAGIVRNDIGG